MKSLCLVKFLAVLMVVLLAGPQQVFAIGGNGVGVGLRSYKTHNIFGHTFGNTHFSKQIYGRKGFYFEPNPFRNSRAFGFQHDLRRSYNGFGSNVKGYSQKVRREKTQYPQFFAPPAGGPLGSSF